MALMITDECINCDVCEPECPIEAIKPDSEDNLNWLEINKEYSAKWPNISLRKEPMPEAEKYKDRTDKKDLFSSKAGG